MSTSVSEVSESRICDVSGVCSEEDSLSDSSLLEFIEEWLICDSDEDDNTSNLLQLGKDSRIDFPSKVLVRTDLTATFLRFG
jgi:hypothetical protein